MTDTDRLFVTAPTTAWEHDGDATIRQRVAPNAEWLIVPLPMDYAGEDAARDRIIDAIAQHVRAHGPYREIVFESHGRQENMVGLKDLPDFLTRLDAATGGRQAALRIVFDGCDTFNLDQEMTPSIAHTRSVDAHVRFYRDYAMRHGTELVGATTTVFYNGVGLHVGRYVRFGADGSISRDAAFDHADMLSRAVLYDPLSWEEAYIGQTPEHGLQRYEAQPGRNAAVTANR